MYILGMSLNYLIYVTPSCSILEIDILQRHMRANVAFLRDRNLTEKERFEHVLHVYLKLSLKYDPDSDMHEVIFEMPEKMQGGFFKANKSLNMMPKKGYERTPVSVSVSTARAKRFFIYIKSRRAPIYTRVEFEIFIQQRDELRGYPTRLAIRYDPYTNPYGERNIKPVLNLPDSISKKLEKEARRDLGDGRLADKSRLIFLIEELIKKQDAKRK